MNDWLFDTNILLAFVQPGTRLFQEADRALTVLRQRRANIWIAPQTLSEFYATLTRPVRLRPNGTLVNNSGYGKTSADALREVANMETLFELLDDRPETFAK